MLSVRINDMKRFTALLFTGDAFDKFCLREAVFKTAATTEIDGTRNPEFYHEEEELPSRYILWQEMRPVCFSLIRGSRLPVFFKLVFLTQKEVTEKLRERSGFTDCEVTSLTLNVSYREGQLTLTAGVSYQGFSMDKSMERYWDAQVTAFLEKHSIDYIVA